MLVTTGEHAAIRLGFRQLLEMKVADIIQSQHQRRLLPSVRQRQRLLSCARVVVVEPLPRTSHRRYPDRCSPLVEGHRICSRRLRVCPPTGSTYPF